MRDFLAAARRHSVAGAFLLMVSAIARIARFDASRVQPSLERLVSSKTKGLFKIADLHQTPGITQRLSIRAPVRDGGTFANAEFKADRLSLVVGKRGGGTLALTAPLAAPSSLVETGPSGQTNGVAMRRAGDAAQRPSRTCDKRFAGSRPWAACTTRRLS